MFITVVQMVEIRREDVERFIERYDAPFWSEDNAGIEIYFLVRERGMEMFCGAIQDSLEGLDLVGEIMLRAFSDPLPLFQLVELTIGMRKDVDMCRPGNHDEAVELFIEKLPAATHGHNMDSTDWPDWFEDRVSGLMDILLYEGFEYWIEPLVIAGDDDVPLFFVRTFSHGKSPYFEEVVKQRCKKKKVIMPRNLPCGMARKEN
jgi:hypothetical protein